MRRLPVVSGERDPLERPRTVADCRGGIRPCPWVSCRYNMLVDVLEDGELVINAKSHRLRGADRTIPNARDVNRQWYVIVRLPSRRTFSLGPLDDQDRALEVRARWEGMHGRGTARIHRVIPPEYTAVGGTREGAIDAKFLDEAEDAVAQWFDEPDPSTPSCVLDEVERGPGDDLEYLLEEIAVKMHVSRERIRQVESAAMIKLIRGLRAAGLSIRDEEM